MTSVFSFFLVWAAAYLILFVLAPFLAALVIHRGFEKFKIAEVPFKQVLQACFYASSVTIALEFLVNVFIRSRGAGYDRVWVFVAVYVGVQMVVVPLLIKQRSGRALLVEAAGILLAAACGYAMALALIASMGSG